MLGVCNVLLEDPVHFLKYNFEFRYYLSGEKYLNYLPVKSVLKVSCINTGLPSISTNTILRFLISEEVLPPPSIARKLI